MSIITLTTQGSKLKKISRRIILENSDKKMLELPVRKLDGVITFGNIQFSNQAVSLLSNNGIPLTYLSFAGKPKGQFLPSRIKNLDLRYNQYKISENEELSLQFAKSFVFGKIISAKNFIKKAKRISESNNYEQSIEKLQALGLKVIAAKNYQTLLGLEANISKTHFSLLKTLFKKEITFTKRTMHPPEDEVNSLMSLTYTLLGNLINAIVNGSGLDTYTGFLHKNDYGRNSLSLDILELFRFDVADKFVLNLTNLEIIKLSDFEDNSSFRLNKDGITKFMAKWVELIHAENNGSTIIKRISEITDAIIKGVRESKAPNFKAVVA